MFLATINYQTVNACAFFLKRYLGRQLKNANLVTDNYINNVQKFNVVALGKLPGEDGIPTTLPLAVRQVKPFI